MATQWVTVEAGVCNYRPARELSDSLEQLPEPRLILLRNRLHLNHRMSTKTPMPPRCFCYTLAVPSKCAIPGSASIAESLSCGADDMYLRICDYACECTFA